MQADLAALVSSRICHDLISPIGAIGNGVELLALTDGDAGAEMELINESVRNAAARIKYFRLAFGQANAGQTVSRSEVISVLTATARGGRFNYIWHIEGEQPRILVRAALLMLQVMETALPLGGDLQVRQTGNDWVFEGQGPRITVNRAHWEGLLNPADFKQYTAAQVQFALLPTVLSEVGRSVTFTEESDRLLARF